MSPNAGVAVVVEAALLRGTLPDATLREGASIRARVASRGDAGAASLVIAGRLVSARVPESVPAGTDLRLRVDEVTPERVVLRMLDLPLPALGAPPPAPPRVTVDGQGGGDMPDAPAGAALSIEVPGVGRVVARVQVGVGGVTATLELPVGALIGAQAREAQLRAGLAARTGLPASVRLRATPGSAVDVRA